MILKRSEDAAPPGPAGAPRALPLVAGAALAAGTAASGFAAAPAYASPFGAGAVLALWAVASVPLTMLLNRRLPPAAALLAGLPAALAGALALAAWAPGGRGAPLADVLDALPRAGSRLLDSPSPVPVMVDTLLFPALAVWLGGAAGALAWRSGRALPALLPGTLLLVGATALGGGAALWPACLLACSAAVLLVLSAGKRAAPTALVGGVRVDGRRRGEPGNGRRWAVRLLGCVAVCAAVAVAAPTALAGWRAEPYDPRPGGRPQAAAQVALNPLGYLPTWAANPETVLMTVRGDRANQLRWVALADFTGTTWLPESRYPAAGRLLPAPDPEPPHATRQEAEVEVEGLPGPWLPVVGSPRSLGAAGAGFDPASGTAVLLDGEASGASYTVSGDVAHWRPEELTDLRPPADDRFDRYRYLPAETPPQVGAVVDQATAEGSPYEHAVRLARYLRTSYTFDPRAPSGHGLADLGRFLVEPGQQGGGGTSEQFASAFAVLARAAGLPSRVVIGFDSGSQETEGEYTVTTGDAIAWGEVYFEGAGWVPFDVTPGGREPGGDPEESGAAAGADDGTGAVPDRPGGEPGENAAPAPSEETGRAPLWAALGAAAVAASGTLLVVLLRVGRSRRRLAAGRPDVDAVLGAWRELREALRLTGSNPRSGSTVTDVVRAAAHADPTQGGTRRLRFLHRSVNAMAFGTAGSVTGQGAERAVEEVRSYVRDLRGGQSRWRRWSWWLDPRPLFWRAP
ncbi:transglutaminase domain-containing protein [Actinorugispora endophytica]|uniref:Transglutaminase superfamily protein n=1 Tax=Actinorugispora endophytica TaxID=1605990 RepID=A0A4R6V704_9ACTN|nr:transglutaminase domain-containing protein [Actinorugispora endophytica]TDQ54992.1 transglutaminase superfamily protein [Actinorugispora endophytica]